LEQGDRKGAEKSFKKAISVHSACVDAYLHLGDLYAEEGKDAKAVEMWKQIFEVAPPFIFLAFDRLERAFFRMGRVDELERILRDRSAEKEREYVSSLYLGRHLLKKGAAEEAEQVFREVLDRWSGDREARRGLIRALRAQGKRDAALEEYERMLDECLQEGHRFRCRMCGYRGAQLSWKCPQCHRWDTLDPEWQVDAGGESSG
jgi:lipopolysaccharide biosynthesis regulator YciM